MPEGDTVHKIANYLGPLLDGQPLESLVIADRSASTRITAGAIRAVRADGKHLYLDLDTGFSVRSHLGMHGSWHRYPEGQSWQKPRQRASLVLRVAGQDFVCFNAKQVELVATVGIRSELLSQRTGPDLTTGNVSIDAIVGRVRDIAEQDTPLIDLLLDQRIASGIGNVYKSELLFIHRLGPGLLLGQLDNRLLQEVYRSASELLASNLGGGRRVTRRNRDGAGRLWVYRRAGLPCHHCDRSIAYARLGRHHRSTYWCPDCQSDTVPTSETS